MERPEARSCGPDGRDAGRGALADVGYVPALDGLRAIAVLSVIVYHLAPQSLPGGFAGVDIFFVISGFVVAAATAARPHAGLAALLADFYARRAVRILPALIVMLLCAWVAATLFVPGRMIGRLGAGGGFGAFFGVGNIFLAFAPNDYFAVPSSMDPFLHTWTLGVEEQFYLILPFLLWLVLRRHDARPWAVLVLVAAGSVASLWLYARLSVSAPQLAFYLMPTRFWELGAGVVLYLALPLWIGPVRRLPRAGAALAWSACFAAIAAFLIWRPTAHLHIPALVLPTGGAFGLVALACARPMALPARLLAARGPAAVGLASYSLYLWHWPVLAMMRWTVGVDGPLKLALAAALGLALGTLSFLYVERPVRRAFRTGAFSTRRALALGAGALLAGAAAAWLLLRLQPQLTLTTEFDAPPPLPASACGGALATRQFVGGSESAWPPCRPGEPALFVLGDSHAHVYQLLAAVYAARTGRTLILYEHPSCEFPPFILDQVERAECRPYHEAAVKAVARRARPGDIVFLPSLHLGALADPPPDPAQRAGNLQEAMRLIRPLAATGAAILLEAPKPRFPSSPFLCSDWFNRSRPYCRAGFSVPRGKLLEARSKTLEEMRRLAQFLPRAVVWDPFPILCPGDPCSAKRGGQWLFSDENHPLPMATLRLLPSFSATARAAVAAPTRPGAAAGL